MGRFNGTISAKGIGTRKIRIERLLLGLGIITNEAENRTGRSLYPVVTTGSSFTMELAFVSYDDREDFTGWMRRFEESLINDKAKSGVMTIRCPARDFVRTAVHESELEYGEGYNDVKYTLAMRFCGASDPTNLDLGARQAGISYFKGPKGDQESQYFYPAGRQIAGAESLDGTLYDPVATGGNVILDEPETNDFGPIDPYGLGGGI